MKLWIVGSVAAMVVSAVAATAPAATVTGYYVGVDPSLTMKIGWNGSIVGSGTYEGTVGQFNFNNVTTVDAGSVIPGTTLKTWCIDIQDIYRAQFYPELNPYTFTVRNSALGFDDYQAPAFYNSTALTSFFNGFYDPTAMGDQENAAAFQLCVWEILWDLTPGNIQTGNFYAVPSVIVDDPVNNAISKSQTWLTQFYGHNYTNIGNYSLVQLSNDQYQDQVFAVSVPLPTALPVGLTMLAGLFAVRKMRRS